MSVPSSLKSTSLSSMRPRRRLLAVYFFLCGCLVYLYIYILMWTPIGFFAQRNAARLLRKPANGFIRNDRTLARETFDGFDSVWFGGCGNLEDFIIGNHTQSQDAHAQICADVKSAKGICGEHSHKFTALVSRG